MPFALFMQIKTCVLESEAKVVMACDHQIVSTHSIASQCRNQFPVFFFPLEIFNLKNVFVREWEPNLSEKSLCLILRGIMTALLQRACLTAVTIDMYNKICIMVSGVEAESFDLRYSCSCPFTLMIRDSLVILFRYS